MPSSGHRITNKSGFHKPYGIHLYIPWGKPVPVDLLPSIIKP